MTMNQFEEKGILILISLIAKDKEI